jgi:hypothetical protein
VGLNLSISLVLNTFKKGELSISLSRLFHAEIAEGINDLENIYVRRAIVT